MTTERGVYPDTDTIKIYRDAVDRFGEVRVRCICGLSRSSILRIAAGLRVGVPVLTHAQVKTGAVVGLLREAP